MTKSVNRDILLAWGEEIRLQGVPNEIKERAYNENYLFSSESIDSAIKAIADTMLNGDYIDGWLPKNYELKYNNCLVIMAGNIPLVGFFDMFCSLVLGVECYVKPSSKDRVLMEWCVLRLKELGITGLHLWDGHTKVSAVIATGSNNAVRYFEEMFSSTPIVIRGNRSSVAVIDGGESDSEIDGLWHDMFDYYGLGCRSVSHLYIPENYDIARLLDKLSKKQIDSHHFRNAYKQAKALAILNSEEHIDCGFFIARYSTIKTPPMAEVTYSVFDNNELQAIKDRVQVVIGHGYTPFGMAQKPTLHDWADGINLFDFFTFDVTQPKQQM